MFDAQNGGSLRVAVVGGGITGLSAAYTLAKARRSGAAVEEFLIEGSGRLGGVIHTELVQGFVIDGGPDSFLTEKPEARLLCEELGISGELIGSNDAFRQTYVRRRDQLVPLPDGLTFFVPTRPWSAIRSPLFSTGSKLAILREFLRRPRRDRPARAQRNSKRQVSEDESVADFVRRHFGSGLLESVVQPLVAGVYGAEPEDLSSRAVLSRFLALEAKHGSLIRGALKERNSTMRATPIFTTLRNGLEELVHVLSANLSPDSPQPRCQLGEQVVEIAANRPGRSYSIHCESGSMVQVDAIILALPACHSATLLKPLHRSLADLLAGIPYTPAVTVALAFQAAPDLPPGFGYLVPRREGSSLLACTFAHSKFPGRAPEGGALLRCFMGGSRNSGVIRWSDEGLVAAAMDELRAALNLSQRPDFYRIFRWQHALPQYLVGHERRVQEIREKLKSLPGLFLAGNAYAGLGIPDCIRSGQAAAQAALLYQSTAR